MCKVQSMLGHGWLPETCRTYPRATVQAGPRSLETAHLSCPQVINLLRQQSLSGEPAFESVDDEALRSGSEAPTLQTVQQRFEWYVQQVMAWRGPLGVRLYDIDVAPAIRMRYWTMVLASGEVFGRDWVRTLLDESTVSQLLANGAEGVRHGALQAFMQRARDRLAVSCVDIAPFLERYLEVKFRNHGFPWNPFAGNYTATFLDCVLPFSHCTLLLWTIVDSGGEVDATTLERAVYTVEKSVSHNTRIFDFVKRHPVLLQPERYREALLDLG